MTIKTFWTILLKIIGLWLLLDLMTIIAQLISNILLSNSKEIYGTITVIGITIMTIAFYIFIIWLFLLKPYWLIEKLQLDNNFDEEKIELNFHRTTILTIATIVIGGVIFTDALPKLFIQIYIYINDIDAAYSIRDTKPWMVLYLAETILGLLLMTKSNQVVKFIEKHTVKQKEELK